MFKKEIPIKYNKEYFRLISDTYKTTARIINQIRWDFVKEIKPKIVLDYGAGACFLSKYAPKGVVVDTYDIGDFPVKYTGIRHKSYDLIFLCDVLEHIPDFREFDYLWEKAEYVYISIPILPKGRELKTWKHFKPGEHYHYFTERSLDLFFEGRGFENIKSGYPECKIRSDIYSVLYKRSIILK